MRDAHDKMILLLPKVFKFKYAIAMTVPFSADFVHLRKEVAGKRIKV